MAISQDCDTLVSIEIMNKQVKYFKKKSQEDILLVNKVWNVKEPCFSKEFWTSHDIKLSEATLLPIDSLITGLITCQIGFSEFKNSRKTKAVVWATFSDTTTEFTTSYSGYYTYRKRFGHWVLVRRHITGVSC
jgi:hypothetical protein